MEKQIEIFKEYRKKILGLKYFEWLMSWDQETEAPSKSIDYASKQYEVLADYIYSLNSAAEFIDAIEFLHDNLDKLDETLKMEIKQQFKQLRVVKKVPKAELIEYQVLLTGSSHIWAKAKRSNDFELFAPTLEKVVAFNRKLVKYLETDEMKGYDILLDMYEEDFNTEKYDEFFSYLKENLVPFVLEVTKTPKKNFSKKLLKSEFPIDKQKEFSYYLTNVLKYDLNRGVLKESEHPFTSGVTSVDTRITTHYYEYNLASAIFSTIHETGHAIYEQQNDQKYDDTFLHGGTSLGIHESQSRMFENMFGRSLTFWKVHYPKLVELFPKQLKKVPVEDFYKYINQAKRSFIRIEADELTYSLHIMLRYELEKQLINGKLKVKDLPRKWKQLMKSYVGITPKTDSLGVLQDVHWSSGLIGYFPTYALGTAYAAQIYSSMDKDININKQIEENNFANINNWLKEHIHKFACLKTPAEIMKLATKEEFNPKYFVKYLKDKYSGELLK